MLHKDVLAELLEDECAVARERLGGRTSDLSLREHAIYCFFASRDSQDHCIRLDGRFYDAEPFRVAAVDDEGEVLPGPRWPQGLYHSEHPVLGVPFTCVQGTYEYHCHPSHLSDVWDRYRHRIRLADLLDHLLRRCGQ